MSIYAGELVWSGQLRAVQRQLYARQTSALDVKHTGFFGAIQSIRSPHGRTISLQQCHEQLHWMAGNGRLGLPIEFVTSPELDRSEL